VCESSDQRTQKVVGLSFYFGCVSGYRGRRVRAFAVILTVCV
jgi:hypothetical protein